MENKKKFRPDSNLKLMDQVRQTLRYYHYAIRTEQTYCQWIKRYLKFYEYKNHPKDMGAGEVERYLSSESFPSVTICFANYVSLRFQATSGKVAASTQRQALNALIFMYRDVLDIDLGEIAPIRSKRARRPPTVMTQAEVRCVLDLMEGTHGLMARLLYGCGLRLMECIRLRIQDVDFGNGRLYVRDGKGGKDRTVLLPDSIQVRLKHHIERVAELHQVDLSEGHGSVYMPNALAKKYPNGSTEIGWQYVFPSKTLSKDPRSGETRRHHVKESGLQKAVKLAVRRADLKKWVTCHTFRHSYATHLLENGTNIRMVQELMGHKDVKTTEIYTHVMEKDLSALRSPLDEL
jgi:integron integrase